MNLAFGIAWVLFYALRNRIVQHVAVQEDRRVERMAWLDALSRDRAHRVVDGPSKAWLKSRHRVAMFGALGPVMHSLRRRKWVL